MTTIDQTISLTENQPFFVSLDVWSSANWWGFLQCNYIGKHWRKLKVSMLEDENLLIAKMSMYTVNEKDVLFQQRMMLGILTVRMRQ